MRVRGWDVSAKGKMTLERVLHTASDYMACHQNRACNISNLAVFRQLFMASNREPIEGQAVAPCGCASPERAEWLQQGLNS